MKLLKHGGTCVLMFRERKNTCSNTVVCVSKKLSDSVNYCILLLLFIYLFFTPFNLFNYFIPGL